MKRLVICCDGTWNELDYRERSTTNVVKIAQATLPFGPHPTEAGKEIPQLVFYDEGVGVGDVGVASTVESIAGGALGAGLMRNVEDAYRFVVFNYEPGDDIHVFGFSRGAFTARSLVGLIRNCGIPRRDEAPRVGEAIDIYRSRDDEKSPSAEKAIRFRIETGYPSIYSDDAEKARHPQASTPLKIGYLGIWDTVGKVGLVNVLASTGLVDEDVGFHDLKLSRMVLRARHALALDETRANFSPTPFDRDRIEEMNREDSEVLQQWFPGGHGGVGGGGNVTGLSDAALEWVAEGAGQAGLAYDLSRIRWVSAGGGGRFAPDHTAALDNVSPEAEARKNRSLFGRAFGYLVNIGEHSRREDVRSPTELSDTALKRWRDDSRGYKMESFLSERFGRDALLAEIDRRGL